LGRDPQVPACPERFGEGCLEPGSLGFFSSVLLWRGAMSKAVDLNLNLVRSEKIQKLLKNYPPKKQ
jgi:hypothetical protein